MDQKWIQILMILVFCQKITSGRELNEGDSNDITCKLEGKGSMVVWLRALEKSGIEFIASYSTSGMQKKAISDFDKIYNHKIEQSSQTATLTLKSFKNEDSGLYSCACLIGGNELVFGTMTTLSAKKKNPAPETAMPQPKPAVPANTACPCKDTNTPEDSSQSMFCDLMILGPLAGGCGLLLLLLIVATLYCNRIRTRRCPHHYKRKPRMAAPEKQMMTNRHF
ncbi:T-cell surface glycoprotein CD8 alpha chain isoform 1-T2 [Pholidichthys leucotaenia]